MLTTSLLLATGFVGCSTVPESQYPPFAEHFVTAEFVVPELGRIALPASNRCLVVHELSLDPPPQCEHFGPHGQRWGIYPAGTSVRMRCRFRAYGAAGAAPPAPAEVLSGARNLRVLEQP